MSALHPRLGVSTWSLHKSIDAGTPMLNIPAQLAASEQALYPIPVANGEIRKNIL